MKQELSIAEIKELMDYDPETGVFTWARQSGRAKKGDVAGCTIRHGFVQINIKGNIIKANRLAWALTHGEWPDNKLWHIDGDNGNNAIGNLSKLENKAEGAITQDRLKHLLNYNPDTGVFMWARRTSNRVAVGDVADNKDDDGYIRIRVDGINYRSHRLAWLYVYGELPDDKNDIDHINGVVDDNRIANLREVTHEINLQNQRRAHKRSKSMVLGCSPTPKDPTRYRVRLSVGGVVKWLGVFDSLEEAEKAHLEAKRKYHPGCTI